MSVLFTRRGPAPQGKPSAADLEVGSSVFLKVNGTLKEFLIVHQGNPDTSLYDASCDGTWLLMKDCYESRQWHNLTSSSYSGSKIHAYLNGDFLNLFDANIRTQIKTVKIPYVKGSNGTTVTSGTNGLSTQIFLLSGYEIGFTTADNSSYPVDGAKLDYFESGNAAGGTNRAKRIAYLNGTATYWWTRSPLLGNAQVWLVYSSGSASSSAVTGSYGIRPALILPSNALFDPDTKEFVGVA